MLILLLMLAWDPPGTGVQEERLAHFLVTHLADIPNLPTAPGRGIETGTQHHKLGVARIWGRDEHLQSSPSVW